MATTVTERRIATIQAALDEMPPADLFAIAEWPEADGDGGYLIARDGRMLAIGDYQHGFDHIQELQGESPDAKQELRQVAGHIRSHTEMSTELGELPNELDNLLPALAAWARQEITTQQVDALRASTPESGQIPTPSSTPANGQVSLLQDVWAQELGQDDTGAWGWRPKKVGAAGDTVPAFIRTEYAPIIALVVNGSAHLRVSPKTCTITQPPPAEPSPLSLQRTSMNRPTFPASPVGYESFLGPRWFASEAALADWKSKPWWQRLSRKGQTLRELRAA